MMYTEEKAKELVIEAGKKLVEKGLISRTWGNVSARLSDKQFVITPSGKPYETLTPNDLVIVNIDNLEYKGKIKPSSEKGVHAAAYKLRTDINFVIHTHQLKASVVSTTGLEINKIPEKYKGSVGTSIPCCEYGLPSTKKLSNCVENSIRENPNTKGFIMKHHGALCLGKDYNEAFEVAIALEDICEKFIEDNYLTKSRGKTFYEDQMRDYYLGLEDKNYKMPDIINDLGKSIRDGTNFILTMKDGKSYTIDTETCVSEVGLIPKVAKIHSEIYKSYDVNCIEQLTHPDVLAVSAVAKNMKPLLDDFSQLIGPLIEVAEWNEYERSDSATSISKKLFFKNAVIIKDNGAICVGKDESDLTAVKMVMQKGCKSQIGAKLFDVKKSISFADSLLMRTIYLKKYSKQAN